MAEVIVMKGAVTFSITLDPSVWIFDDRKIDLRTYRGEEENQEADQQQYVQGTGAQWDRELKEGAPLPTEKRSLVEERKALEGDWGMRLAPFIEHAQPQPEVTAVRIHRESKEPVTLSLSDAKRAILQFAKDGKPIREGGPALLYLPEDWAAGKPPIDAITAFEFLTE